MAKKILIVEDDDNIRELLRLYLEREDYEIIEAENGAVGMTRFKADSPDMILLDMMMPVMDGWQVCREIRESGSTTPIIMITAKGETMDKVSGLELGADDYIVKPFDLDELAARVEAHLRREQRRQGSATVRFFGELAIDYGARTAALNGVQVPFSRREFDIVELLSLNAGQVFDRERIYEAVWGYDGEGNSDTIMEHIRKIRAKLAAHTRHGYIDTVWGCGYRWNG